MALAIRGPHLEDVSPRVDAIPEIIAQTRLVCELIQTQVSRRPLAIAVTCAAVSLSYAELSRRAGRVAENLRRRGARPGSVVATCLDPSLDLVVVWLGILQSGAAILTLEPGWPALRITSLLADSGAELLLTRQTLLDWDSKASGSDPLWTRAGPLDPAYLSYARRGEDAGPGVLIAHAALANTLQAIALLAKVDSSDRVLAANSFSGDLAYLDVFLPLIVGAMIVIAPKTNDPSQQIDLLSRENITFLQITPTALKALVDCGWNGKPDLKILCGGTRLDPAVAGFVRGRCRALWHAHGPVQAGIWATAWQAPTNSLGSPVNVPAGRPLANTRAYILDSRLQPVPIGVFGELYLGGIGATCAHHLSSQSGSFVTNPFKDTADWLFRTGDRARFLPGGDILLDASVPEATDETLAELSLLGGTHGNSGSGYRESVVQSELLPDLAAFNGFCSQEKSTRFEILLAACLALLSRYARQKAMRLMISSGSEDACLLHGGLSGNPTVRELLARTRRSCLSLSVAPALQRPQVFIQFLDQHSLGEPPSPQQPDLIFLFVFRENSTLETRLTYNSNLFEKATARRMLNHLRILLEGMLASPSAQVSQLPLLGEDERTQMLIDWNQTAQEYPSLSVHRIFEACARRNPGAVALVHGARHMTYQELDRKTNQLAIHLRSLGIGREARVAVIAERSFELIVAFLAILKAGAAYVPIDPTYPASRIAFMLDDSNAALILTTSSVRLPDTHPPLVMLDTFPWSADWEGDCPESCTGLDNLAYVMYTSGSTGQPKGVEVLHRGIVRLLFGVDYADFNDKEVFLQLSPAGFDASTFEIWGPLLHGGCCVLFSERVPTASQLSDVIRKERVTTLLLTPSLFNHIVDEKAAILSPVRQLLIGGEALSVAHVRRAWSALPSTRLVNAYGPTEGTTIATCYPIPRELSLESLSIPIGRPIANTRVYVLDEYEQPVPVGVPGELYIGGDGLARGYSERPALTAAAFVEHRLAAEPGPRLYRTGDLVRFREDGNIEFLGRLDSQVKIRGHRIEPGEVEAALARHPDLAACAVAARLSPLGETCLVAYVEPRRKREVSGAAVEEFLKHVLPPAMIPAATVVLSRMPLLPSGKVDRAALPTPDWDRQGNAPQSPWPRDVIEAQLTGIWQTILRRKCIGIRDDFFQMGGHSLLASRIIARISAVFGVNLPLVTLFERRTIEQLATAIEQGGASRTPSSLFPIQPYGSRPPLILLGLVGWGVIGDWLKDHLDPGQPCFAIPTLSALDGSPPLPLPYRIEDIARLQAEALCKLIPGGSCYLAGFCLDSWYAYEIARQLTRQGHHVPSVFLVDPPIPDVPSTGTRRTAAHRSLARKLERLRFHAASLRRLGFGPDGRGYVADRFRSLRQRILYVWWRHAGQLNLGFASSRTHTPEQIYLLARSGYQAGPFQGRVVIFQSGESYLRSRKSRLTETARRIWGSLAAGGIHVEELPGSHMTILQEPCVGVLGAKILSFLQPGGHQSRDES